MSPDTNKSGSRSPIVEEAMKRFEWAFNDSIKWLNILDEIQQGYDNEPDNFKWSTVSQVPVPVVFNSVEKSLPQIYDRLFPRKSMIRMTPLDDEKVTMEQIQNAERYLEHTLRSVMRLKKTSYNTIKDCFKLGVGYGIIEQTNTTPFISKQISAEIDGKRIQTRQMIERENVVRSVRYKYINPGQVIPTPDGSECNGPKRASTIFYFDIYREQEFRDLYNDVPIDGEDINVKGNLEEIINIARDKRYTSKVPIEDIVANLAGIDMRLPKDDDYMPILIPVLKCYSEKQHLWIACGEKLIYSSEHSYQTLRCPVVKASAWPDSDRWFPTSPPWVTRRLARGMNVFTNALMDMLAHYFDPPMVYNASAMSPKGPPKGVPGEKIGLDGTIPRIQDAVGYLTSPPMPTQIFTVGDLLNRLYGDSVNQPEFINNASPGIMRGGGFAFGDLNRPISMRDALAASVLESGWLEDVVNQTMINVQTVAMAGTGKISFVERTEEYDESTDALKEKLEKIDITIDDIVRAYNIEVDLDIKHDSAMESSNNRFAIFDRLKTDPTVDQYENKALLVNDDMKFKRLMPSRKKARKEQEDMRQAQLEAIRAGNVPGQAEEATNLGEQAVTGALAPQPSGI